MACASLVMAWAICPQPLRRPLTQVVDARQGIGGVAGDLHGQQYGGRSQAEAEEAHGGVGLGAQAPNPRQLRISNRTAICSFLSS